MGLEGKVVIITGASSGMGAATARLLAQHGAKLTIVARRVQRLNEMKAEFPNAEILPIQADVTKLEQMEIVVNETLRVYKHIDVLWNNAGIMPINELRNGATTEWRNLIDVNIHGVLNGVDTVLPTMIRQGAGHIITTDSVAGFVTRPKYAVYAGSKAAVKSIMEGLRQEEGQHGIKTTVIYPGQVATELANSIHDETLRHQVATSIKSSSMTVLSPEEIAQTIAFIIDTPANMSINELVIRPTAEM
ncbi:SDR family oxidoreductase [Lactiplantibacillus paraplantarum]|uniref:SDR family oxidoreductase n=1 Tax=Lactiplantibacillus paraplantarum TaxID=60520 RepID=A0AAD0TPP2_9LACO|nr:SDR family oxidoreductase [Lactiplantibacillus paraplantarum]AVW09396.1 SDR family NAD(P)-dependent oxidoreductase [Lactiplantibacillus paraplantarum]AYJ37663.1 SDR family oxidoreductase [Lactiplantibacillus paraplantarum]ERL43647.1 Short-chain alcohol dehydrogenase of unknown specificity [Lactiplantibacillus paraplantarum]KRL50945.1 Short-chain alcohol dehydrogenase of unknown specificity [Lactiplantibacillus paraplantarum DSM 10667]MCU4682614.1 SDR family oxidoreductase [Lactiplantibacill